MWVKIKCQLPEEREEYDHMMNGIKYYCILSEFDNFLRAKDRYNPDNESEEAIELYRAVRKKLFEICSAENVEL